MSRTKTATTALVETLLENANAPTIRVNFGIRNLRDRPRDEVAASWDVDKKFAAYGGSIRGGNADFEYNLPPKMVKSFMRLVRNHLGRNIAYLMDSTSENMYRDSPKVSTFL